MSVVRIVESFPLRPEPEPSVRFKGTYREEGWKRCNAMAEPDGIHYTPYPRDDYPSWSLPALEAAKCVALQGPEPFERLHLRLYEAFFTRSVNIADYEGAIVRDRVRAIPTIIVEGGARLTGLVDLATYRKAIEGGG